MDGKPASEILHEMHAQMLRVCLKPDLYPQFVLTESEQGAMTDPVVFLMNEYGEDIIQHVVAYTINYMHGVEGIMFFTEVGKSLLGFAPWLALRMFAIGLYVGTSGKKAHDLLVGEEEKKYWQDILEVYENIELIEDSTMTVTEVDNPFAGETLEEQ